MKNKDSPKEVWQQYQDGRFYKESIGLYDTVRTNENFYIGNQWEGLNAPDLPKPTLNFLKRVVNYCNAMIVSDDIAAAFTPVSASQETNLAAESLSLQVEAVMEQMKLKSKFRDAIRDALVDGDCCLFLRFDPTVETGQPLRGDIVAEAVENINVYFGNPYMREVEKQPYLILAKRVMLLELLDEAERNGVSEEERSKIRPDNDDAQGEKGDSDSLCTKLIKLWKEEGTVHCAEYTDGVTLRRPFDTGYTRYPLAWMSWERVKSSCHGQAILTGLIQNQIQVNRLFAMTIRSVEMNAFPKIVYDPNKIRRWTNATGEAIKAVGGVGGVSDAFSAIRGGDVSAQVMQVIEATINMTRDFMGASDAVLGNVDPDNTSAIIAVQQTAAIPLQLQKMDFYRFVEDVIRIMLDIMRACYGVRLLPCEDGRFPIEFDFSSLSGINYRLNVDVGASSYWSELTQMQTMESLYTKGLLTDAAAYVESIPAKYLRGKEKLLAALRERQAAAEAVATSGTEEEKANLISQDDPLVKKAESILKQMR